MDILKKVALVSCGVALLWFLFGTIIKVAMGAAVLGVAWFAWHKFKKSQ